MADPFEREKGTSASDESLAEFRILQNLDDEGLAETFSCEPFDGANHSRPFASEPSNAAPSIAQPVEPEGREGCMMPATGRRLGNYELLERVGEGGMGTVYRARHTAMDRIVAVKTLRPRTLDSQDAIRRFRTEIRAVAKLIHPNIVTAFDAGEVDGQPFLAMEYVEGQDLHTLICEQGPLPVGDALTLVIQAARSLEYAHRNGIIHRDVKPANFLLADDGTVKLLDLGLARMELCPSDIHGGTSPQLTRFGQVMGTVDFMAPEQATDAHCAGAPADIYSLGCTLFFVLTGRCVYGGDSLMQRLIHHRESPIPHLTDYRPDVPAALDALFREMVAKEPNDRPHSMESIVTRLERVLHLGARQLDHDVDPHVRTIDSRSDTRSFAANSASTGRDATVLVADQPLLDPVGLSTGKTQGRWRAVATRVVILLAVVGTLIVSSWLWLSNPRGPSGVDRRADAMDERQEPAGDRSPLAAQLDAVKMPVRPDSPTLQVHFQRSSQIGTYDVLSAEHLPLRDGDRLQIHATFPQPTRAALIAYGSTGDCVVLFPGPDEPTSLVREIHVPGGRNDWLPLEPPGGIVTFLLIAGATTDTSIEETLNRIRECSVPRVSDDRTLVQADEHGSRVERLSEFAGPDRGIGTSIVHAEKSYLEDVVDSVRSSWPVVRAVAFPHETRADQTSEE